MAAALGLAALGVLLKANGVGPGEQRRPCL